MEKKLAVPYHEQVGGNTCWEAVAKMVLEYMGLSTKNINEQQNDPPGSAIDLLMEETGAEFVMDGSPFPKWDEIKVEIDAERLLIGYVGDTGTDSAIDNAQNGHWIIIAGYDDRENVYILDPAKDFGKLWMKCPQSDENGYYCYQPKQEYAARYFQSTSYMPET